MTPVRALALLLLCVGCASTPDARTSLSPCAQARLAREFTTVASFAGCYVIDVGPVALQNVGVVVLTDVAQDHLDDEPPKYALATTQQLFATPKSLREQARAPVTTSWEQLSASRARLVWLRGIRGIEACVEGGKDDKDGVLEGSAVVVDDVAPYAHAAGPLRLQRTPCPQ